MSQELKVGDKVIRGWKKFDRYADNIDKGEVIAAPTKDALTGNPKVYVKWDSKWCKPNPEEVEVSSLMSQQESDQQYSKLEKEFKELEVIIETKLAEAGKLIREASSCADSFGVELNSLDAIRPLYQAMDACGWNTSSFSC